MAKKEKARDRRNRLREEYLKKTAIYISARKREKTDSVTESTEHLKATEKAGGLQRYKSSANAHVR